MSATTTQANNAAIEFRGKAEREMPVKSQAQSAAMHAAAEGHSTLGIPAKVGKEFVAASHGKSIKKLPKHVRKAAKRGLISEKQMQKVRSYD